MLKKLVKFGNSTALVVDKAILELLGMAEGSVVKLTTDGKSLTITPHVNESSQEKPSQTIEEYYLTKNASVTPPDFSPEDAMERQKKMQALTKKYEHVTQKTLEVAKNPEYKKALELLVKEHEETGDHEAFEKKSTELACKFIPGYKEYKDEIEELIYSKKTSRK